MYNSKILNKSKLLHTLAYLSGLLNIYNIFYSPVTKNQLIMSIILIFSDYNYKLLTKIFVNKLNFKIFKKKVDKFMFITNLLSLTIIY